MTPGEKDGERRIPAGEHHANPLSVLVEALKMAWGLVVLVALGLAGDFFAGNLATLVTLVLAAAGIFAACLALSFVVWRVRTWELADEGLVVRWGLLNRRRLTIPYEHIHTVSMNSTLFERIFGLVALDLDTGAAATERTWRPRSRRTSRRPSSRLPSSRSRIASSCSPPRRASAPSARPSRSWFFSATA